MERIKRIDFDMFRKCLTILCGGKKSEMIQRFIWATKRIIMTSNEIEVKIKKELRKVKKEFRKVELTFILKYLPP